MREVLLDLPLRADAAEGLDDYAARAQIGELLRGCGEACAAGALGEACAGDSRAGSGASDWARQHGLSCTATSAGSESPHGGGKHGCLWKGIEGEGGLSER